MLDDGAIISSKLRSAVIVNKRTRKCHLYTAHNRNMRVSIYSLFNSKGYDIIIRAAGDGADANRQRQKCVRLHINIASSSTLNDSSAQKKTFDFLPSSRSDK